MSVSAVVRRPLARPRASLRPLAEVAAGLIIAALAAALTRYVEGRDLLVGVAATIVVVGSLWLATTRHTGAALALFMIYIGALDGYLKLSIGSSAITLVRDVLLYAIVVGLLLRAAVEGRRFPAPPLSVWVLLFVVLVLVQILNPDGGTVGHSLAGVRQHLEFVPLFFLTYAFVRTTRALRVFVTLMLVIAAANGVVSFVQFNLTPQQLAAWGPGYAERVLAQGRFADSGRNFFDTSGNSYVRPFGLGSEAGAGGLVGALAVGGILAMMSLHRRLRYLLFASAMAIAAVVGIVTSQGRAVVVSAVVVGLAYGLLTSTSRGRLAGLVGLAAAGLVAFVVAQAVLSGGGGEHKFRYKGLTTTSGVLNSTGQARGQSLAHIPGTVVHYPLGAGLAVAGPATGTGGGTALTGTLDAENEFSFMTLETGVPGALLIIAFTATLLGLGLLRVRHEPDPEARPLLAAVIAPLAGLLALYVAGSVTATTPGGPYLWAAAGIVSYWLVARPAASASRGVA